MSWLIQSDWAELLFVALANTVHPQLVTMQWRRHGGCGGIGVLDRALPLGVG